jgi:hypothetical protein
MSAVGCSRALFGQIAPERPKASELCCNGSWAPLALVSDDCALRLEDMECQGDESRLCCTAPAAGQGIVATGVLDRGDTGRDDGWMLRDPKLCSLE